MNDLLFEIGVENIPARFITSACSQMEMKAAELLKKNNLSFSSIKTFGTYKRLVLYVEDIPPKVPERIEKFFGPPAKLLKNEKGEYTQQARGFANSHGVGPEKLSVAVLEKKGETLCLEQKVSALPAIKILSSVLKEIVSSLQFPKNMIWEESRFRFARPIRNIAAVYGSRCVPLKIAGIKSSKNTTGLISKGSKKIPLKSAGEYVRILEKNRIIPRDAARKEFLLKELERTSSRTELEIEKDEELLEENVYLTEYPVCVVVKFPNEFLELPPELLGLVMKKQLKFFPCRDRKGEMQPYFVGVRDGVSKGQKNVEDGFLSVFEARCRDALFFYKNDLSVKSVELAEKMKSAVFQEKLGSILDKRDRVRKNLEFLLSLREFTDREKILETANFVYLDLASSVVREFPELQGVMSYYYAKNWGLEDKNSWKALGEFYFPLSAKSPLPSGIAGIILSLAGKIDTLAGDFALGLIPTGSQDPHALRRQAYGLARIIFEKKLSLNLTEFCRAAVVNLPEEAKKGKSPEKTAEEMMEFIWQRVEAYFSEKEFQQETLAAVKDNFRKEGDILLVHKRLEALKKISASEDFKVLAALHKRAKNILKGKNDFPLPDQNLFEKESERELFAKALELKSDNAALLEARDYFSALKKIETLKKPLEDFFNEVMVMAEDPKIRNNRLSLVNSVYLLFEEIADISKLQH